MQILAVLGATTNVGDADYGIHILHEHGSERAERRFHVDAKTSVAVEQGACISRLRLRAPANDVHRDAGAILAVVKHLLGLKVLWVMICDNIFADNVRTHLTDVKSKTSSLDCV